MTLDTDSRYAVSSVVMLSLACFIVMLSVVMLDVIMLRVVATNGDQF
jgi:hypothetical protein